MLSDKTPAKVQLENVEIVSSININFRTDGTIFFDSDDPQLVLRPTLAFGNGSNVSMTVEIAAREAQSFARGKIYVDRGDGFHEKDAIAFGYDLSGQSCIVLDDAASILLLRWDPDELRDRVRFGPTDTLSVALQEIELTRAIGLRQSPSDEGQPALSQQAFHARSGNLEFICLHNMRIAPDGEMIFFSEDPQLVFSPKLDFDGEKDFCALLDLHVLGIEYTVNSKIYIDRGQGFAETSAVKLNDFVAGHSVAVICDPATVRSLRWDPVDGSVGDKIQTLSLASITLRRPTAHERGIMQHATGSRVEASGETSAHLTNFLSRRIYLDSFPRSANLQVRNVSRLLLGFTASDIAPATDDLIDIISAALNSVDFQDHVAQPALRGEAVWFDARRDLDAELSHWFRSVFGSTPANTDVHSATWRGHVAFLLGDATRLERLERRCTSWLHGNVAMLANILSSEAPTGHRDRQGEIALIEDWGAFDKEWYLRSYGLSLERNLDPILDYLQHGEEAGRRPNALFDPDWIRSHYSVAGGINVLCFYIDRSQSCRIDPSPYFSNSFYRECHGDETCLGDPFAFYMRRGWRELHDPNVAFDARWYTDTYHLGPETNALVHYLDEGAKAGLEPSPYFRSGFVGRTYGTAEATALGSYLAAPRATRRPNAIFDPAFYLVQGSQVDLDIVDACWHYRHHGFQNGRDPSPLFRIEDYFDRNEDVRLSGREPFAHYLRDGAAEGRRGAALFDEAWYLRTVGSPEVALGNAFEHYMEFGYKENLYPNPLFDAAWYRMVNVGALRADENPLSHYANTGWQERRNPNAYFDIEWYLERHPDLVTQGREPLAHLLMHAAGNDPGPAFDTAWYAAQHPESDVDGWSPFAHFLHIGRYFDFAPAPRRGTAQIGAYASWQAVNPDSPDADRDLRRRLSEAGESLPTISVVMPAYETDPALFVAALESVRGQVYGKWQLCVCDDASPSPHVGQILARTANIEPRLRWTRAARNLGISGATNAAAALATGEVIALLDHDDLLHAHALGELALAYAGNASTDIVYTDDDKIDAAGRRFDPQFKPGWSPTLLLGFMYMSHLFSFRRDLFETIGGVRAGFDGSQDYDLALRLSELARHVEHVPKILYHWRAVDGSTAVSGAEKPEAFERGRRAVQDAFDRRGIVARVSRPEFARVGHLNVLEPVFPDSGPPVTIIIPTRNKVDLLRVCIASLQRTAYENYEILVVDNESDDGETLAFLETSGVKVLRAKSPPEGFSFAHLMNLGVAAAEGEYVLLLNNDTEVREPNWLSQMVGYAQMPGVGAVGARLLYEDGRLQHAGILHGLHEGMAGHAFKLLPEWDPGYLLLARVSREVSGVTAACLLTSKRTFQTLGGLDETNFRVAYNDVDFCYRLVDSGLSCIQCGSAELFHYEGRSRGFDDDPREITAMRSKYRGRVDPFYNPNLTLEHEQFAVGRVHLARSRTSPVRTLFVSHNFNAEGAPNSLFELATGLVAAGRITATVISPEPGPLLARYAAETLPTAVVETPLAAWPPRSIFEANIRRMAQAFLYSGCEVVVVNTADSFWAVLAAREAGLPCLWIIRESAPWQSYYTHFPPHIAEAAYDAFTYPYRIVFVARSTMEAWKPLDTRNSFTLIRNGLDSERMVRLLSTGSRADARRTMEAPDDACVFICIGTVTDRKGQIDMIQALASMPADQADKAFVVVVGDRPSPYSDQVHRAVAGLPAALQRRVRIIGETTDARNLLVGADVFICASRVESYPRVTLEAMAAGLPLITTDVWGIREQVRPNYNALIYQPGDIATLCAHMREMVADEAKRQCFASRSIPVFQSLPNFQHMRDGYAALIEQAVGSTGAPTTEGPR